MSEITAIWERQPDEKIQQYRVFWYYCKSGDDGSLAKTHADLTSEVKQGQRKGKIPALKTIETWSSQNGWVKRKDAYWSDIHEQERLEFETERQRRRDELVKQEWEHYDEQIAKWEDAYSKALYHEQDIVKKRSTGETVRIIKTNARKLSELTTWRMNISKFGRLALNMPQTSQNIDHTSGGKSAGEIWDEVMRLSDADLYTGEDQESKTGWE